MSRSLIKRTTYLQLLLTILLATGCAPAQPFFLHESPDLQYYLNTATQIEYPDVEVESLTETTEAQRPLSIGNHDYQFWNLTVEDCVSIALQNAKFFVTTSGNAEFRQNIAAQFTSATADQLGSIYDVAIQQATTQSIPLTVDGNGNRVLPRGVQRANQIGGVEDALSEFDAQASSFIDYSTTDRPRNTGDSTVSETFFQSRDATQQSAISKRFATGSVATLRQQVVYSRNNLPLGGPGTASRQLDSDWTALLEAQIQQPLMRNRGTLVNRIPVVLASLNEDISITDFEVQVRNLVRDIEVAYWNLYVAYRSVNAAIIGRNSAIATAKFSKLNYDNGTGTKQELAQAEEQYYGFRARLSSALAGSNMPGDDRFGVYGYERVMRELMGLAATDGRLIRPTQEPSLARLEFDWTESVVQMLYLSPELRKAKTLIKQRELEQVSAKNQILPEVNLSLLYRWVGVGDTLGPPGRRAAQFPSQGSSALGSLTGGNFQEGVVRLEITPPAIGARRELTRIRGTQLRLQQSRAYLQDAERLLVSQLSDAVAKAATHYQLVQTNAMRWQASEQEVEARLAEYKGGRSPVNVVLQSQQRRADAQISYYRALGEYNKSINYVDYLKGTMLANNNITLSEGPWNKKAYWDALERARERSAGKQSDYGVTRPGVVRRGPVLDAEEALEIIGSGTLLEEQLDTEGIDSDSLDRMQMDLLPSGPIEIDDTPLRELGSTQNEMLAPKRQIRGSQPQAIPMPKPNEKRPNPQPQSESILTPIRASQPLQTIAPLNYETSSNIGVVPEPVQRKPLSPR